MNRITGLLLALLGIFLTTTAKAQLIRRLEIEPAFGVSRVDFRVDKSANPDFLNYLSQEEIVIDAAHFGFLLRFELVQNWEFNFLLERHVEFAPFWEYACNKETGQPLGCKPWCGHKSFIIGSIDKEYNYLKDRFKYETMYYYENNPFNVKSFLICPFLGVNYSQTTGRFNFRYTFNSGLAINKPINRYLIFKEIASNYVYTDNYDIPSKASVYLKPEVYACYKFIDNKNFVVGLRLKVGNYLTRKDLDYTRTHYEWTDQNPIVEKVDLPKHWLNCLSVDFGLLYERK